MPLTIEDWKGIAEAAEAAVTTVSLLVGGVWVYMRYVRQQEKYPNIEFSADVQFIGTQGGVWIVELIATIENKGKAQHRMEEFAFDLNVIERGSSIGTSERWGNQVDFPVPIARGSFLPQQYKFFFIDPGLKAKYSYIARIPVTATFAHPSLLVQVRRWAEALAYRRAHRQYSTSPRSRPEGDRSTVAGCGGWWLTWKCSGRPSSLAPLGRMFAADFRVVSWLIQVDYPFTHWRSHG